MSQLISLHFRIRDTLFTCDMDRATGKCVICQGDILFREQMSSLQAVCSNQALAQRLRRDGFAILETQKTWNHPPWLKSSPCFWFSLVAPVAACQRVHFWKGSWRGLGFAAGCFHIKWPPMEWKGSLLFPSCGWHQSLLTLHSHAFSVFLGSEGEKSNTEVASKAGPWGSWWRALSPVIDGPDFSITLEEQATGRVVCSRIVPN